MSYGGRVDLPVTHVAQIEKCNNWHEVHTPFPPLSHLYQRALEPALSELG